MDNKIIFDLALLKLAFEKAIEIMNIEIQLLSTKINIDANQLDQLCREKEDVMNFIEWHMPIIVRYINMHYNQNNNKDIINSSIRMKAINKITQDDILKKTQFIKSSFSTASSISINHNTTPISSVTIINTTNNTTIDFIFVNDSDSMPAKIKNLLVEMCTILEKNYNHLIARKRLNEGVFKIINQSLKDEQQISYSPKNRQKRQISTILYSEEC